MPISKSRPRRPTGKVTPLDTPLSPRRQYDGRDWTDESAMPVPPQWLLDKIAEETLHKGFTGHRHATCPQCFVRRSSNGRCNCPKDIDAKKVKKLTQRVKRSALADALGDV